MKIVPVLDIMQGVVVRAVGGERSGYRPLVSKLTTSTDPLAVASSIRARYQLSEIYVADLDAIDGAPPAVEIYDRLRADGFRIWVDAGVRETLNATRIADHVDEIIIGSETGATLFSRDAESSKRSATARDPRPAPLPLRVAAKRLIFSLDLRDGQPLGDWNTTDPLVIAERAIAGSIQRLILLDLARVGTNTGPGTEQLARTLIHRFAHVEVYVGGGIRNRDDIQRLQSLGISGVLVASALHDVSFGAPRA